MNLPNGEGLSMLIRALEECPKGRRAYYATIATVGCFALDDVLEVILKFLN